MLKSFFKSDERWSREGMELSEEIRVLLVPVFEKYNALGYSNREIALIADDAALEIALERILNRQYED